MKNLCFKLLLVLTCITFSNMSLSQETLLLKTRFNEKEIEWFFEKGTATLSGMVSLNIGDGKTIGCEGYTVEVLPAGKYADERFLKVYGNNVSGQVLLRDNSPKFTPDSALYHETDKVAYCNENGNYMFKNLPAGEYYIFSLIKWQATDENGIVTEEGGAAMKRITLESGQTVKANLMGG